MIGFIIRRLASMVLVLFAVSVLVFAIFNIIPGGDPAVRMAGKNPTDVQIEAIRKEWGFDKPVTTQYAKMIEKTFDGQLISYSNRENVLERIKEGLPRTLSLTFWSSLFMLVGGIALGMLSALRPNSFADRTINAIAVVGISLPVFWIGGLMSYYLGSKAGIIPAGGYVSISEGGVLDWFWHLLAPSLAISFLFIGIYSRVLRGDLLDALRADYVRTAEAKGLSKRRVVVRHALRNALIPMITLWGLDVAITLGGGAVLTETVFDLDGVGAYLADSTRSLDVPPVMAITLLGAIAVVVMNAIIDILYAYLDPRIRL
ncbi:MAG: ABC transporter permease [Solirubrobacteraceae bacterium]|nr:ABC transporter permease [Solirubrobacteraceae bacterium]